MLSRSAARKSTPLMDRCILPMGKKYPLEAANCIRCLSAASIFASHLVIAPKSSGSTHTCTPNTTNPNNTANVLENVATANPPSNPTARTQLCNNQPKAPLHVPHFISPSSTSLLPACFLPPSQWLYIILFFLLPRPPPSPFPAPYCRSLTKDR